MQDSFHEKVASAAESITRLMPSYISSFSKEDKDGFVEVILGNPSQEDKPIWLSTAGEEITFSFAESHFHISDYSDECEPEELIEEMISAIVRIVTGVDLTYSGLGRRAKLRWWFHRGKTTDSSEIGQTFKKAKTFKIWGWHSETTKSSTCNKFVNARQQAGWTSKSFAFSGPLQNRYTAKGFFCC